MKAWNLSKIAITLLKLTVFSACLFIGFRYLQKHEADWRNLELNQNAFWIIPSILLLSVINWGIESLKWQKLIQLIKPLSFKAAVKATLSGVATSFVTPFRVGDFVGRVIHLDSHKKTASILTFYGNFTQLMATLLFGLVGLALIPEKALNLHKDIHLLIIIVGFCLLIFCYATILYPKQMAQRFKLKEWLKFDLGLDLISKKLSLSISALSLIRYSIFLIQFYLAYRIFGADIDSLLLLSLISLLYLFITFIPSPLLGKLGVRESVALFLIGPFESSEIIVAASLLIWFINLFIPAIIGSVFLLKVKSLRSK